MSPLPLTLNPARRSPALLALVFSLSLSCSTALQAAPGDLPVPAVPAAKLGNDKARTRTTSLPAKGLFVGDQLSESAKQKLTELIIEATGLRVEVALLVPVGPWVIDGATHTERDLTSARLNAVRRYLTERGIEPHRIFVEQQTDPRVKEPRLDVQLAGQQAND
jgi:OmpA-OmpF porin, OOP family